MEMHIEAAAAFRKLLDYYKRSGPDYVMRVATVINRSQQTVKQYSASPTSKSFRKPPLEVIDALREEIMLKDVYFPMASIGGPVNVDLRSGPISFNSYVVALDCADARGGKAWMLNDRDIPPLTSYARLRHQWRQVAFGGIVSRSVLAEIAGTGFYEVGWVGREHDILGIQPTEEMVARAIAAEALTTMGRIAA